MIPITIVTFTFYKLVIRLLSWIRNVNALVSLTKKGGKNRNNIRQQKKSKGKSNRNNIRQKKSTEKKNKAKKKR